MDNRKPTFARIGKIDDPKTKSKGGHFILLIGRDYTEECLAIFNFDPATVYYRNVKARQCHIMDLLYNETRFSIAK